MVKTRHYRVAWHWAHEDLETPGALKFDHFRAQSAEHAARHLRRTLSAEYADVEKDLVVLEIKPMGEL